MKDSDRRFGIVQTRSLSQEGNQNIGEVLQSYRRDRTDLSEYTPAKLVSVGTGGREIKPEWRPPRDRSLVIGLGQDETLLIGFNKFITASEGFHEQVEAYLRLRLGDDKFVTFLHGSIEPEGKIRERAQHVIRIVQIHERDLPPQHILALTPSWELGKLNPGNYLNAQRAQRLMRTLSADRLDIVRARPSRTIYEGYRRAG